MKVYEKINQLKGTVVTMEDMTKWAYMNRICPVDFENGLELDSEYPKGLEEIAFKCCNEHGCGTECLEAFLNAELENK